MFVDFFDQIIHIEQLPYTDKPEVFGLHENANITYQSQETDRFTSTILSIQPRVIDSSSGKGSGAEKMEDLAKHILDHLPAPLQQSEGLADLFTIGIPSPLSPRPSPLSPPLHPSPSSLVSLSLTRLR